MVRFRKLVFGKDTDMIQIGMGFPKTWTIMIPCRMLLGLFEAGFFPGCVYLLSILLPRLFASLGDMLTADQAPGTLGMMYKSDTRSFT